jgi:mono/diheme cytochrome c family protein
LAIAAVRPSGADEVDFARDIRPILAAHCHKCHGPDKQESALRLDSGAAMLSGGNSGPAIVPGKPDASLLIQAVRGADDVSKMPPDGDPLSAEQIEVLRRWIEAGAPATGEQPVAKSRRTSTHWSFQPLAQPAVPRVTDASRVRNPIDSFVLQKLEAASLTPSAEAPKATLLRRACLDLTGLLPSVEEVDAFLADNEPGAYERVVDRLLDSPHYGERWARHWLDVARYADSNGYTIDGGRSIWKYRDWVIEALNRDLPFDQFAIEQIAGDMLPEARAEQIIATGFHRNTLVNEEGGTDKEQFRVEAVVDRVSTTGVAFLGLTLGCARCHDHKYDPISQREFYQFFAVFNNADEPSLSVPTDQQAKELPALVAEIEQSEKRLAEVDANSSGRQAEWESKIAAAMAAGSATEEIKPDVREALAVPADQRTDDQKKVLREAYQKVDPERVPLIERITELKEQKKQTTAAITTTLVVRERKEPRETHIHLRGDFLRHGAAVEPNVPEVLPSLTARAGKADRLDFARWLVGPANPLTPRVNVNRIWQTYFGQGLVATENDFGLQGSPPTHPELLDWLAGRLIDDGWSLKSLHRLIVTSATYRQASSARPELTAADPYNKLLGRQQRLRVEAETIRDAALAASGMLTREIGGPGVYPPQPEGIYRFTQQVKFWGENKGAQRYRRGMYTYFWRSSPYPFLKTFDAPDATMACTRRVRSNTPLQALTLANDRAFFEIAQGFADQLLAEPAADDRARVSRAFRHALAREPSTQELADLVEFLETQKRELAGSTQVASTSGSSAASAATPAPDLKAPWVMLARVLLNLDEFVTRE